MIDVPDVEWSVEVRFDGDTVLSVAPDTVRPSASMGKVLLLICAARAISEGSIRPDERLRPEEDDRVGDSGLWQHLEEPDLTVSSLAVLVGAVSDNLAANVLLRRVGMARVQALSEELGVPSTRVLDRIRDVRGPLDPAMPSVSTATDLATVMSGLAAGGVVSEEVSRLVVRWLSTGVDLSMVASAFALDPLAHLGGPLRLFHKTGADDGVRADAGHVCGPRGCADYAVLAQWEPPRIDRVGPVLAAMREIGALIVARIG